MDAKTALFEDNRHILEGIAYRMLGTLMDARDVVQDTYLEWAEVELKEIRDARAWLVTVCTRRSLNFMKSARVRREQYVGTWLPEPLVDDRARNPAEQSQVDDTISVALLVALEKLSPAERAAFLLHEVFGYSFEEVAPILGKSPVSCRKLASRARSAVRDGKPRFSPTADQHSRLVEAFLSAARSGDLGQIRNLLADDVEFHADGGGKAVAVAEILRGREAVSDFVRTIWSKHSDPAQQVHVVPTWFNGAPGVLIYEKGRLATALTLELRDGSITHLFAIRNPDKLVAFSASAPT